MSTPTLPYLTSPEAADDLPGAVSLREIGAQRINAAQRRNDLVELLRACLRMSGRGDEPRRHRHRDKAGRQRKRQRSGKSRAQGRATKIRQGVHVLIR